MEDVTTHIPTQGKKSPLPFIHRDISWLQFNGRVLEEAEDISNPLLERVKFLAISATNLDEFHMVRVSALEHMISNAQRKKDEPEIERLQLVRSEIYCQVRHFLSQQARVLNDLCTELQEVGIILCQNINQVASIPVARTIFLEQVLPELPQPLSFAPDSLTGLANFEVAALCPGDLWLRLPPKLAGIQFRVIQEDGLPKAYCFFLDHLLQAFLIAHAKDPHDLSFVRLTRNADDSIDLTNSDPDFIPDTVLRTIANRERSQPVRLELGGRVQEEAKMAFATVLKIASDQLFLRTPTLFLHAIWKLVRELPDTIADVRKLRLPPLPAYIPEDIKARQHVFTGLRERDYILHHPYDSFEAYVGLIEAAASDADVTTIEQTVYRMDAVSPVIALLKEAARTKEVRVVIEPRARFDEMNNLRLAEELRQAGVKVFFGFGNLKLHAKIALITRKENDTIGLYTHLSTGNYNAATARQYTDLGLVTAHPEIGADARQFFDSLYRREVPHSFRHLVIAPQYLARRMLAHIRDETEAAIAGKPARIFAKVNALVDDKIVEALYMASQAGVQVDLIVRGACSLLPGVPEVSEKIRVLSIVDRFLEHSRIYYFGSSKRLYLSSADWMPRNFFSRLEIAFPILDQRLFSYVEQCVIPTYLGDRIKARELCANGTWKRCGKNTPGNATTRAQHIFESLAAEGYRSTVLARPEERANARS